MAKEKEQQKEKQRAKPKERSSLQTLSTWQLQLYPNPTESGQQVTVSLTDGFTSYDEPVLVKLFSTVGVLLFNQTYPTGEFTMTIPTLAPGIYVLHVQTEEGELFIRKVVVH